MCRNDSTRCQYILSADSHGGHAAHEELQDHAAAARVQICKDLRSHVTPVVEESGRPNAASLSIRHRSSTYIPALSPLTAPPGVKTGEEAARPFLLLPRFSRSNLMPMATYASRPAWELRARAVSNARIAVPLGIGVLLAVSVLLRTPELGTGFWIDEGLSVGIADRPLGDIPGVLRQDGSPPLYYMLLHFWLGIAGRSEESVHGLSLLFATLTHPGRVLGRLDAVRPPHGVDRGAVDGRQPIPHPVRAGGPHVRARLPAGDGEHDLLAAGVHDRRRGAFAVRRRSASRSPSRRCSTRTTGRSSSARRPASPGWCSRGARAATERRRLLRTGALAYGGAFLLYAPWIPNLLYQAAHTGAPWSRTPSLAELASVPARILGRIAELARAARRGRGRRGAGAGPRRARPRRRRAAADRLADGRARLDQLAAVARVGQPLLRRRRRAVRAARGRRLRARRPARAGRARDRRRAVGGRRGAGAEEQRARRGRGGRPVAAARRPRRLDLARAGPRARVLPAARACATRR